jgi:hypothetical protein
MRFPSRCSYKSPFRVFRELVGECQKPPPTASLVLRKAKRVFVALEWPGIRALRYTRASEQLLPGTDRQTEAAVCKDDHPQAELAADELHIRKCCNWGR